MRASGATSRERGRQMKALVNVARYHLADRVTYVAPPWGILAPSFLVSVAVGLALPGGARGDATGALVTIYLMLFACGVLSMTRDLPFGLILGVSRRAYYLGTALLVGALGVIYGLVLAALQAVERVTGGWGVKLLFFR